MKLFASKAEREELQKQLEVAMKNVEFLSQKWGESLENRGALMVENEALRADLNEYREIFCNKQKEIDVLRTENEKMRDYITETENKSQKACQKALTPAQKRGEEMEIQKLIDELSKRAEIEESTANFEFARILQGAADTISTLWELSKWYANRNFDKQTAPLTEAQALVLDAWNAKHPDMMLTPEDFAREMK